MPRRSVSDAYYLLAFFMMLVLVGASLLSLPLAWDPAKLPAFGERLLNALFMATSAVCVTGLATVNVIDFSYFGQVVLLCLIQLGGLGIITFTSIILTIPGNRLPLRRLRTIQSFYVSGVEYEPARIVRSILLWTISLEALGAAALYAEFRLAGVSEPAFNAVFCSISAFCNAGFARFPESLESFSTNLPILATIAILVVGGGLGFIVLQDIGNRVQGRSRKLNTHTRMVLTLTGVFILVGAVAFLALEWNGAFKTLHPLAKVANALFQSITPRTAGFDAVPQVGLAGTSQLLTIFLMFVGGSPGSIAGGIKITTMFVVFLVMVRRPDRFGDLPFGHHRVDAATSNAAITYFLKALALLAISILLLSVFEGGGEIPLLALIFEAVSAFATVGLSLGYTSALSVAGKLIIIVTMYAGRVGLIALAFPGTGRREAELTYPKASVLLG